MSPSRRTDGSAPASSKRSPRSTLAVRPLEPQATTNSGAPRRRSAASDEHANAAAGCSACRAQVNGGCCHRDRHASSWRSRSPRSSTATLVAPRRRKLDRGAASSPGGEHAPAAGPPADLRDDHRDRRRARAGQFEAVKRSATGVLASSAVLGLVVGLRRAPDARERDRRDPARDHPADPDRRPRDVRGRDRRRSRTSASPTRTSARRTTRRLIVPNERLAQSTIENHTIVDPRVRVEVEVWLPPRRTPTRALEALGDGARSWTSRSPRSTRTASSSRWPRWAASAARARRRRGKGPRVAPSKRSGVKV